MESRPQNPEFRNNPENFHPCIIDCQNVYFHDQNVVLGYLKPSFV